MTRSKQSSQKREKEKTKLKKKREKEERRVQRKSESKKGMGLDALVETSPRIQYEAKKHSAEAPAPQPAATKGKGRVAFMSEAKDYGFIKDTETRGTLYFQISTLAKPVKINDLVVYSRVKGPKGMTAISVEPEK
jgi:cold shock CspA family protein